MRLLITAGPTREPIDEVRFLSNRSSGKLGIALAQSAQSLGHQVTLLLGPVCAETTAIESQGVNVVRFQSCADLQAILNEQFPSCDTLIMAAAVADYRPIQVHNGKLPRARDKSSKSTLELEPTPDLVASLTPGKRADQRVVAFALEQSDVLMERATAKMKRKSVDAIVANPLDSMESDAITPTLIYADGQNDQPGAMPKSEFAGWLIHRIEKMFASTV